MNILKPIWLWYLRRKYKSEIHKLLGFFLESGNYNGQRAKQEMCARYRWTCEEYDFVLKLCLALGYLDIITTENT